MTAARRHPPLRILERWLETGRPERVADHIGGCLRCTALLESDHPLSDPLRAALHNATEPPEGLYEGLMLSIVEGVRRRQAVAAFADLFTLGWRTPQALIQQPDGGRE